MGQIRSSSVRKAAFIVGGLLLAGALALATATAFSRSAAHRRHREKVQQTTGLLISNAVLLAQQAVQKNSESFRQFVLSRKAGTRAFGEDVTSVKGKWRALKPCLPFTDKDGHKQFVSEVFETDVVSRADLGAALKRSIEGSVRDVEGIQNDLAVQLRQEIAGCHLGTHEISVVQQGFRESIHKLVSASQRDAAMAAANLVASEAAVWVGGRVFAALGADIFILGAAGADSWWTCGASLALGLGVDLVWNWITDPVGQIQHDADVALDQVARNGKSALLAELAKLVAEKKRLWEVATTDMIKNMKGVQ
jgi:hypothetical protein